MKRETSKRQRGASRASASADKIETHGKRWKRRRKGKGKKERIGVP
jgi:hypothetical protein